MTEWQEVEKAAVPETTAIPYDMEKSTGVKAVFATIEQSRVIPTVGSRQTTTKWEYWSYVCYYFACILSGIGGYGGALQQALIREQFPDGMVKWGGSVIPVNSLLLDLNGILFAVQLVCLILFGPYADYGQWRPSLLIVFTSLTIVFTFAYAGLRHPSQWEAATALYILGNVCANLSNTFYWSAFPVMVRDMVSVRESEDEVVNGTKSAEKHESMDMLQRSKAAIYAWDLREAFLYLIVYFLIQDVLGTVGAVTGILQNKTIHYNTIQFSGITVIGFVAGGSGTVLCNWVQQRYNISVRNMLRYGALMTLGPSLWGVIGIYTTKIGFHNSESRQVSSRCVIADLAPWEFWLQQAWNFQTAAWGSYSIVMISEVVPAPKIFLFLALFTTVGKTSSFIGPFISSALIDRADGNTNMAFWFLFPVRILGNVLLWLVNPDKAKIDNAKCLEREAAQLYSEQQRQENVADAEIVHVEKAAKE